MSGLSLIDVWYRRLPRYLFIEDRLRDEPVLVPGPESYDQRYIALNQVIRHKGRYYALYHGTGTAERPREWCIAIATSKNLLDWKKFPGNPLLRDNQSSGIFVHDGTDFRLYAMHKNVQVYMPRKSPSPPSR